MKLQRIRAVARKEWIQIRRDTLSLAMAFLLPLMLLLIYAYAITFDVDDIFTVVYDQDKSSISRELIAEFEQSGYFTVVAYIDSYPEIDRYLDREKALVAIILPTDFSKNIRAGKPAGAGIVIDGTNSNTAMIASGYVAAITQQFSARLGFPRAASTAPAGGVEVRSRVWYNPELKSRNFIIPGLIALIMSVIISLLTSLTISREWDRGTMEQLISTPVKPFELAMGKLIPYFVIGFADTALSVVVSTFLLKVPLRGSPVLLLVVSAIFLFGGLAFGILLSAVGKNQLLSSQVAMLTSFLPSFMLSGFIFSISNMPAPLQLLTYAVPARYFVSVLKGVFLKGIGMNYLFVEILLLTLYAVLVFLAATRKMRKRME